MTKHLLFLFKGGVRNYLLIFLIFILSSCQTTALFQFESLKAPKIIIPPDVKTFGFVDRNTSFDIDSVSNYYKMNDIITIDSSNYDSIRSLNCYLGLRENLSEYLGADSIPFIKLPHKHFTGDRVYKPMEWTQVDSICESTGSDVLVCLEDILIFNEYKIISEEENWGITDIKYYSVWRIYDPLLQKLHDERILMDSLYSEVSSSSYQRLVEEKLPSRKEISAEVAYEIGRKYANLISPQWTNITREYFIGGDQDFILARYYLENDNLEQSIAIWEKLVESNDLKISARAAYNLAMAYELKNDFEQANHWMRKSVTQYRKMKKEPSEFKKVKKYFKQLTQRTQNNFLLDKFFGE